MKKQAVLFLKTPLAIPIFFLLLIGFQQNTYSSNSIVNDSIGYNSYRGIVIDGKTKEPLVFATITVNETNISTVTNTKGAFLLKVPKRNKSKSITISFLGYTSKVVNLSDFNKDETTITLETYIEELSEIKITTKDAPSLVKEVFKRKAQNYLAVNTEMTGFYRETIKKRNTYVSLAEAILIINKPSYTTERNDILQLHKSRKNTNYEKLDTITLKHSGGPYDMIRLDIIKNPELLLTDEMFKNYDFTFDTSTKIDNRVIYVVNFKQKPASQDALFFGKLFIDANSLALTAVQFQVDLSDINKASDFFIVRKPQRAKVKPIQANYFTKYAEKNGKWFHSYSRIELGFKIDWHKKIFNSIFYSTMELAITDWKPDTSAASIRNRDRLRQSVIMADEASGFNDPEFWGEFNVIEPEKPIENAIKKIQKQLEKME
ncbi:carboxypeptidase-like regulatory domain-containing protein [Lutibacter sp. HS1-25]|uniref:carboxypeptidase-like regulatory domain-containing protein n=1 Tax=Lutibacter sp. HS1-25 TaxID=2485000 RepID=UPI001010846D|nr:carboxypeptidase-like regulatory domain-containing protein [Lutibacter sp. HS1-25]RXP56160.1 carboxypeptidase-like regulatory domain-containing protein [Lutibacter sp. HS1-25]